MKKVVIAAFGDESNLAIVESNLPDPVSAEVQLSVEYTIVSGSDVNMRRGTYPLQQKPPLTPGYSLIGKVRLNGQDCSKFKIGDRVACLSKYEGQAELINLPEKYLVHVSEGVGGKAAVALILDCFRRDRSAHFAHETLDALVAAREPVPVDQILLVPIALRPCDSSSSINSR
jgi:NADPH:quinone reductase-like Zn-dependent oxidoreductase